MTPEELAAIEARANAATAGPWVWSDSYLEGCRPEELLSVDHAEGVGGVATVVPVITARHVEEEGLTVFDALCYDDFSFIAAARTDVPALVAEVRRLQSILVTARRHLEAQEWTQQDVVECAQQPLATTTMGASPFVEDGLGLRKLLCRGDGEKKMQLLYLRREDVAEVRKAMEAVFGEDPELARLREENIALRQRYNAVAMELAAMADDRVTVPTYSSIPRQPGKFDAG